jgi:DNA polymerase V
MPPAPLPQIADLISLESPQPAILMPPAQICPLYGSRIPAGFPSPAADYVEKGLDLNTFMIANPASTFYFRVQGDSMKNAHIFDGDIVPVDRSIDPKHRHIVLAVVNNEYTVKRLYKRAGVIELRAENPDYPPIRFQDFDELTIWGVVIGTVRRFIV